MTRTDLQYQDDWARGWIVHRNGNQQQWAEGIAIAEAEYYQRIGKPEKATTGLVDGWKARAEAVRLVAKNEVKK